MKHITAIVLAAGRGRRFKSKVSKPLSIINAKPVIIYCLATLSRHPYIKDIILVVNRLNKEAIIKILKQYRIRKISNIVLGGRERQDSVCRGLKALSRRAELVLIHDGVRPFIDKKMVTQAVREAERCGAAIAAVPVKSTIKKVDSKNRVKETVNREGLWEIQTPQVFRKDLILQAYKRFSSTRVTDDASLVEKSGADMKVIRGSYFNIKVTTPEDMVLAEAIAGKISNGG